jgi:pectate lyase
MLESGGFRVCDAEPTYCGVIFEESEGCTQVCASAGLRCVAALDNLEDECGPDEDSPALDCDSGHESDYCRCELVDGTSSGTDSGQNTSNTSASATSETPDASSSTATSSTTSMPDTSDTEPVEGNAPCAVPDYIFADQSPLGWASEGQGTTGGGSAEPELVTSLSALQAAVEGSTPRVIYVQGTLEAGGLKFGSNKTVIGCSEGAHIRGSVSIGSDASNIIVRNVQISGYAVGDCALDPSFDSGEGCSSGSDAVGVNGDAHHVWFDHCSVKDGADGNLDVTNNADFVTISWCKFSYTPRSDNVGGDSTGAAGHRFSNLVGGTDTAPEGWPGTVPLNVTWHHNWWADNVVERQPRVRYGRNHLFNNYYNSSTSNYCVRAGIEASVLLQGNYFDGVERPHEFNDEDDETTAFIAVGSGDFANVYDGTSGEQAAGGGGQTFEPPYVFALDAADDVPTLVTAGAGPH